MGRRKLMNGCRGIGRGQRSCRMTRGGNWCKWMEIMVG